MIEEIWLVLFVIAIASFVRSAIGFGDALIAMPLLSSIISIKMASPLLAILAMIISITIILTKGEFQFKTLSKDFQYYPLVIACIVGIPIGIYLLKNLDEEIIKMSLGTIIIIFALNNIFKPKLPKIHNKWVVYLFGLISGSLGGAYNTNGPPIVIYSILRDLKASEFRIMIQYVLIPTNVFIITGHGIAGLWSDEMFELLIYSAPISILFVFIGNKASKKIPQELFFKIVNVFLVVIGGKMFV